MDRTSTSQEATRGGARRYYGPIMGVVTRGDDPKKLNRVKVRVPGIGGQNEFAWARVGTQVSGQEVGVSAVPPDGAFVQVAFEEGDPNRPVIVGCIYSEQGDRSTIPLAAQGEADPVRDARGSDTATGSAGAALAEPANPFAAVYPNNFVFKSPSAGHLIEVDDSGGAERISITHGPSKSWIEIHPDGSLVIGVKGEKRYLLVDGTNEEHIKGDDNRVTDGAASYKSRGKFNRTAKSYRVLSLGKIELEGTGPMTLNGRSLEARFPDSVSIFCPGQMTLGPQVALGNIVTTTSHPVDYITGIPIQGTPNVSAG